MGSPFTAVIHTKSFLAHQNMEIGLMKNHPLKPKVEKINIWHLKLAISHK